MEGCDEKVEMGAEMSDFGAEKASTLRTLNSYVDMLEPQTRSPSLYFESTPGVMQVY